jgi:hypothetical protein
MCFASSALCGIPLVPAAMRTIGSHKGWDGRKTSAVAFSHIPHPCRDMIAINYHSILQRDKTIRQQYLCHAGAVYLRD